MRVIGVDGCPGGWVAVVWEIAAGTLSPRVHASFTDLLDAYQDAAALGVDIPIGLSEIGCRACDSQARGVLRHRHPCVFNAPAPSFLDAPTYPEAQSRSRALTGKGITKQAFAIYPKIAEVNRVMTSDLQDRVVEVHPEVSFCALAGHPLDHPKRKQTGYDVRRELLGSALDVAIWPRNEAFGVARPAKPDDLLDATVAAWTDRRAAEGTAERFPVAPPVDRRGLRMEIVY